MFERFKKLIADNDPQRRPHVYALIHAFGGPHG